MHKIKQRADDDCLTREGSSRERCVGGGKEEKEDVAF